MEKGKTAPNFSQAKSIRKRKTDVSSSHQFPNEGEVTDLLEGPDDVLPALQDYLSAPHGGNAPRALTSGTDNEDILQLFDAPSIKWPNKPSGKLIPLPQAEKAKPERNNVVPLEDYQKRDAGLAREAGRENPGQTRPTPVPTPRQVASEYIAPPTNPSQRNQDRRATAKLDYYKKLAELQQMNLEFGRSIRAARNEVQQEQRPHRQPEARQQYQPENRPTPRPELQAEPSRETRKEKPAHPLTTSFHVATKRGEPRTAALPPLSNPPTPHPLPANQQRVTAKLDYNRLLEFQRHYEETHPATGAPTIEDRLANRLSQREPNRESGRSFQRETVRLPETELPRLPVREWQDTPVSEAMARRSPEQGFTPQSLAASPNHPAAATLQRSKVEQLDSQMRHQPPVERVREVLLDPTRIDPHLIALSDFNPRAARYFDQVAVSLISISYKRLCKRVLVASAQQGEGRTCVTLNLAGALARARQRVLVVDCDLANPSVLRLLGIDAPLGLSEAVHRGLGPNSAALRVQPAAFNILPMREKIQHTAELLAAPRFHEMLQLCEPDYDFILFDSSPLLDSADANLLAGLTDATMLVIRPGITTTQQMAKAVALFNEKDICGVVLNRVAK